MRLPQRTNEGSRTCQVSQNRISGRAFLTNSANAISCGLPDLRSSANWATNRRKSTCPWSALVSRARVPRPEALTILGGKTAADERHVEHIIRNVQRIAPLI